MFMVRKKLIANMMVKVRFLEKDLQKLERLEEDEDDEA
jgi:hypothetical protein